MSRAFLADQFDRSQKNLGLASIDLMYLHNAADAQLPVVGHDEFFHGSPTAFRLYESLRDDGRLGGVRARDLGLPPRAAERAGPPRARGRDPDSPRRSAGRTTGSATSNFRSIRDARGGPVCAPRPSVGNVSPSFDAVRKLGLGTFTSVPLLPGAARPRRPGSRPPDGGTDRPPIRALGPGDSRRPGRAKDPGAPRREP